jgi:predicted ATPase
MTGMSMTQATLNEDEVTVMDRLIIPERLYEREIDTLMAAFDRAVTRGTPELVLAAGFSGIGKSSVVNELHRVLVPPRGLFAAGKFDQYAQDIPYSTLAQAFQILVRMFTCSREAHGQFRQPSAGGSEYAYSVGC